MTNELKDKIIKLRSEDKSYGEIAKLTIFVHKKYNFKIKYM